jgi:hypothetical protein
MLGFKTFQTTEKSITGIEAFHMLRKQQIDIMPVVSDPAPSMGACLGSSPNWRWQ